MGPKVPLIAFKEGQKFAGYVTIAIAAVVKCIISFTGLKLILPIFDPVQNVATVFCDQAICGSLGTTTAAGGCAY